MNKNVWLAVLICIGLGVVYFATRQDKVKVGVRELNLPVFDEQKIDKIEVFGDADAVLVKIYEEWYISDSADPTKRMLANTEYVNDLLSAAQTVENRFFTTEREDKQAEFGVLDEKSIKVVLYVGNKPVWQLLVGAEDENEGRFVRVPQTEAIFSAKTRFWDLTRSTYDEWLDRQILFMKSDDISKIIYQKKGVSDIVMVWKKEQWELFKGEKSQVDLKQVNFDRINQLAQTLVNLKALSFAPVTALSNIDVKNAALVFVIYSKEDGFYELLITKDQKSKKIWAKLEGGKQIYEISQYAFDQLNVTLKDFLLSQNVSEH